MKKPDLDQKDKYIKAPMDISRAIASDQYLEDIFKLILMVTAKVTGVENVLDESLFKEKEMSKRLGLVSMLSVPLEIKEEKVMGVFNCFTAEHHQFSETEIHA